jgi:UDP-N-acetylmuramoyl-L-alanyl-D-glutamate--2,6-diaminopimelate ligase
LSKLLSFLLQDVAIEQTIGSTDSPINITQVCTDSRVVKQGALFVALSGTQTDGHKFIDKAIEQGASAILCETLPNVLSPNLIYLQVANAALALGQIASAFYNHPSRQLKLVGVTGTNGKTTTATLLFNSVLRVGLCLRFNINGTIPNQQHRLPINPHHPRCNTL